MLTREDCIAFCGLTEEEVLAIAEHEHVPEVIAAAMAEKLLNEDHGVEKISDMVVDDIRAALARGDKNHAAELFACLHRFLSKHPLKLGDRSV